MSKDKNEKIVNEIIEYANNEIKKSQRRHLLILISVLICVAILSVLLLLIFAYIDGHIVWLFFGIMAIVTAILNVIWTLRHRKANLFRFCSLSFTAFALCSFYAQAAHWVLAEDWGALTDVLPTTSGVLWFFTVASVAVNSISLFCKCDS